MTQDQHNRIRRRHVGLTQPLRLLVWALTSNAAVSVRVVTVSIGGVNHAQPSESDMGRRATLTRMSGMLPSPPCFHGQRPNSPKPAG